MAICSPRYRVMVQAVESIQDGLLRGQKSDSVSNSLWLGTRLTACPSTPLILERSHTGKKGIRLIM